MADAKKQQKAKDKISKLISKFENKSQKDKQRLTALASLIGIFIIIIIYSFIF